MQEMQLKNSEHETEINKAVSALIVMLIKAA